MKRISISLLFFFFALSVQAAPQRFLVVLKSKENFRVADVAFHQKRRLTLNGQSLAEANRALGATSMARLPLRFEESLKNLNAVVIQAEGAGVIEQLRARPEVAFVDAEVFHPAPKPVYGMGLLGKAVHHASTAALKTDSFHASEGTPWGILAIKAMEAWNLTKTANAARVLVLDTGIDRDHASLKANFEEGADFVGDDQQPYPYADTVGHGTHVAGTIAGVMDDASGFTGVAPHARLLMGRVCSKDGCSNISVAKGVNWGIEKNVDLISMSLGGSFATPSEREAIRQAFEKGITVVAAAGNDGTARVSYPAALPQVIAVGAVDSDSQRAPFSQFGPELAVVAPGVSVLSSVPTGTGRESDVGVAIGEGGLEKVVSNTFEGAAPVPTPVEGDVMYAGLGRVSDFENLDVKGKFVLVQRGEIKFGEKVENCIKAGASGVVIFNNAPGLIHGALTQDGTTLPVPVFMIEQKVGERLREALNGGGKVRSRLAINTVDYAKLDGTSMATPHVAGVVALMKSANKSLTPTQVREILAKTAKPLGPNTRNEYGAGLIDAEAAVKASLSVPAETPVPTPVETPTTP